MDRVPISDGVAAASADAELRHESGFAEQIELEAEEGFFDFGGSEIGQEMAEQIEQIGMRIVFFQQQAEQFSAVNREIKGSKMVPEI